jgi:hypothetical protein
MRKWLISALFGLFLIGSIPVYAQTPVSFSKLEVDLWPEYDKPEVLVIYHIFLEAGTALPANLMLSIPAGAGDPAAVAVRNADGQLYNVAYNRIVNGQVAQIAFSSPVSEIQFEYYDPGLVKNGTQRSYTYHWTGEYAVRAFAAQVQQPALASNLQITPAMGKGTPGEGGLVYYSSELGSLQVQQQASISLSYEKTEDSLSVQSGKVGPVSAVDASTPGRATFGMTWIYVLGGVAILLIAGGGYWYWRSMQGRPEPIRKRHAAYREKLTQPSSDMIYCHQCGKKASMGDVFCRSCGMKLRKD